MFSSLWRSLQNRLMLISIGACLAVLGTTGGIATYRLRYDLFVRTNRWHETTVGAFQQDVATYREFYPEAMAIQRTIDKYTRSDRWFKVTNAAGDVLATSLNFDSQPEVLITPPAVPTLMRDRDYYFILCRQPLDPSNPNGLKVTTVTDVTDSYEVYLAFLRTLVLSGVSTASLIAFLGSLLIRRSLLPLHSMSQLSATLSPQTLPQARLILENAPTEVEQLAESFNGMLNRLSAAWDQEKQLLSNISHELRTPLAIVHGYLESTLRRGDNLTDHQRENLTLSLEETQRVVRLLKDLLDLARAESGVSRIQMKPLRLDWFLEEIAALSKQLGPNPIFVENHPTPLTVMADWDRLKQVMLNLISNAIRYSDPDAPITLRLKESAGQALIQVQDQGIGIPLDQQSRIFERFHSVSTSRSRQQGGIGLGLTIAKAFVENMRGRISVSSAPDKGSTFTVTLPLQPYSGVQPDPKG
ncbi:sensor histidine kinase [Thermostichus vulcanus]|uniref:histidine kinase n=1 Tax=Thermostichus vulcanus str. 'Rupite' TaxID=2813851 RepID=A0ABT0CD38_THEVL|nr:HAMP domain-containing histidine kinase [Thermostichus vulcanus str. 'Rupite']